MSVSSCDRTDSFTSTAITCQYCGKVATNGLGEKDTLAPVTWCMKAVRKSQLVTEKRKFYQAALRLDFEIKQKQISTC